MTKVPRALKEIWGAKACFFQAHKGKPIRSIIEEIERKSEKGKRRY